MQALLTHLLMANLAAPLTGSTSSLMTHEACTANPAKMILLVAAHAL